MALTGCSNQPTGQAVDQGYIGAGSIQWDEIAPSDRGEPVRFGGELESGDTFSSESALGNVVVVNFWYAQCAPCRDEAPALQEVWEEYQEEGVEFIGVNTYDQAATAIAFNEEFGITYPSILDVGSGEAKLAFAAVSPVQATPTTLVLDREGRVAARYVGALDGPSILSALVQTVLAEQ